MADCQICGRLARGMSYGVVACVSCRSFYRRCMKKPENLRLKCRNNGQCITKHYEVGKRFPRCKACRFQKYCTLKRDARQDLDGITKNTLTNRTIWTIESTLKLTIETKSLDRVHYATTRPVYESTERLLVSEFQIPATHPGGSRMQTETTIEGVSIAIQSVFGDQISEWTKCLTTAFRDGHVVHQPQADIDEIIPAIGDHYVDNLKRTFKFFEMLPGMDKLDTSIKYSNIFSWKSLISYFIHHAPFASANETYFTIGAKKYHYCRFWQKDERVTNWSFQMFFDKFCADIRDLGLEEVERYLLIAIILLEPAGDDAPDAQLGMFHRHYTDALLYAVRQRSSSHSECMDICEKIVLFFDKIKVVQSLMDWLFYAGSPHPPSSKEIMELLSEWITN